MINWNYAHRYYELPEPEAMKVEALVKIAEQLDRLNNNLEHEMKVKVSGGINTHSY
uniref:Uncharacterized protein n=1 Tax=viral metagenome TaxID=1070528 RepID=A0A6M3LRW3_9ZZZZ